VSFILHSRGEIDLLRVASIARDQRPEISDCNRGSVGAEQLTEVFITRRIVHVDGAVAEISNEEIVAELSESGWRDRKSPWRIKCSAGGDPLH